MPGLIYFNQIRRERAPYRATPPSPLIRTGSPNTATSDSGLKALLRASEIDTRMIAMVVVLIAIWLGLHLLTDRLFLTARNLYNLAVQSSVVGIMATGMVLVIVVRHIDLSVGAVMGFTGMVIAWLQGGSAWCCCLPCGSTRSTRSHAEGG